MTLESSLVPTLESMLALVGSLLALAVIGLAAFGLGRPVLRKLKINVTGPLAVAVWSMTLGLLVAGWLLLAAGWAGWLDELSVGLLSLLAGLWGLVELSCLLLAHLNGRLLSVEPQAEPAAERPAAETSLAIAAGLAAVVLLTSFVAALAPPTSPEALSRTLEVPKAALLSHHVSAPWTVSSTVPNLVQMWFLWALALDGPVAANLLHWTVGLLLALAAVLLARPLLGSHGGLLAGSLVLLCPGVTWQLSVPLEDLALALFTTLALVAAWQVLVQLESAYWAIAAGLMLGGACSTSLSGVIFCGALAIVWAWACRTQVESRAELINAGVVMALSVLWTAGPWLAGLWGAAGLQPEQSAGSVLAHWGPLGLMAVPALLAARRLRGLPWLVGVLVLYSSLAFLLLTHLRWWSPAVPLLAIVAAWVWQEIARFAIAPRFAATLLIVAVAVTVPLGSLHSAVRVLAVATFWQSRSEYLLASEPTYRAASLVNGICRPGDRLFCQDPRTFYFACPARRPDSLSRLTAADSMLSAELLQLARSSGSSYLLLAQSVAFDSSACQQGDAVAAAEPLSAPGAEESAATGKVIPILEYRFADEYNRQTHYKLFKLR